MAAEPAAPRARPEAAAAALVPPEGLAALEARLAHDLACLQKPAPRWTPVRTRDGEPLWDVVIIGAGMAGLALAASLLFDGVSVTVLDEASQGFEGPWATTARMETLRSPKQLAGPALGIPSLTFRAWFEAQWGAEAWEALDKIPRLQWMDYLRWYRRVLALPVRNEHQVTDLWPQADGAVKLGVVNGGRNQTVWARRVVLATGRAGLGGPWVPGFMLDVDRSRWAHSADPLDHRLLRGLRVGVVGAGASAMDSAATALEAGAAHVHLLVRRSDIPRINKSKGAGSPGFVQGYGRLPDAWKWRLRRYIHEQQVPPPRNSTLRVTRHPNAHVHLGCGVVAVTGQARENGPPLRVDTRLGPIALDFLILATGFAIRWDDRPMLRHIAPHVRAWGDRYTPPARFADTELSASPDLGPDFEFQVREGAPCPGLERVHCFSYPAALSLGVVTGDIPAITDGAERLAQSIIGLLYAEDIEHHFAKMQAYAEPEVFGDEWVAEPLPPYRP
jgi:cation diffusion facilitator CzcD-associated flavoprotein CzcO